MKLNRTGSNWTELERNKINENWRIIEGNYNNVVDKVSKEAFEKVVDSAKLNWKEPVDSFADLPSAASEGDTRMARDSGKVYRFNGEMWQEIQQIDAGPVNEVDSRLTAQLAQTDNEMFKSSLVNHKAPGFKVWWIDDDGHKGVYTKIAPLLREYGIKMSSAVITNRPHGFPIAGLPAYDPNSQFMSYEQMKELEEEGIVEFVPHSHTHDLNYRYTDMTLDEIHDDMSTCKNIMRQLGWNYKDLVYPFGAHNAQVRDVARQYFRSAIDIRGGAFIPPVNQFALPRQGMDTTDTQDIINEINKAYENNTLIILISHVDQYGGLEESKMRAVIEHVLSLGGEFITGEEAITNYGNLLQIGEDSISYDGNFFGGRLGAIRYTAFNEFLASTPPEKFERGITITKIDQSSPSNTDGLPGNLAGTLITFKSSSEGQFTHQMFLAFRRSLVAYRSIGADGNWREWVVPNYVVQAEATFDDTTPPKDFPMGETTVRITQPEAQDTPNNLGGILKTIKTNHVNPIFTMQEFKDVVNGDKYERVAESWDSWGPWINVTGYKHLSINELDGTSTPDDFPIGITHVYVSGRPDGLPGVSSGNLITYKENGVGRSYQEFRVASTTGSKYFRGETNTGNWGSWKKFVFEDV